MRWRRRGSALCRSRGSAAEPAPGDRVAPQQPAPRRVQERPKTKRSRQPARVIDSAEGRTKPARFPTFGRRVEPGAFRTRLARIEEREAALDRKAPKVRRLCADPGESGKTTSVLCGKLGSELELNSSVRRFVIALAVASVGPLLAPLPSQAAPSSWLAIDGNARLTPPAPTFDWG